MPEPRTPPRPYSLGLKPARWSGLPLRHAETKNHIVQGLEPKLWGSKLEKLGYGAKSVHLLLPCNLASCRYVLDSPWPQTAERYLGPSDSSLGSRQTLRTPDEIKASIPRFPRENGQNAIIPARGSPRACAACSLSRMHSPTVFSLYLSLSLSLSLSLYIYIYVYIRLGSCYILYNMYVCMYA